MTRAPRPLISKEVVDLLYDQQDANDTNTNNLIDMVMAATLIATASGSDRRSKLPMEVTIDPNTIVQMAREFHIERILNDDGTRGVRLTRRQTEVRP